LANAALVRKRLKTPDIVATVVVIVNNVENGRMKRELMVERVLMIVCCNKLDSF
jgi:hypothetical protein